MALTLTIGGNNFLPQYKTNSASVHKTLQHRSNTMTLQITKTSSQNAPQEGQEIVFKDGSRYLFGGFVTRIDPSEIGEGQLFVYNVECIGYVHILMNKSAQRAYQSQTLKYIAEDLLSEYVDAGYGLTTTGIVTGPTIETIAFDHIDLRTAFEKLAKVSGYEFWISDDKIVHFQPKDYSAAPEQVTDTSNNFDNISVVYDTSQVRNKIVVKGGKEETSTYFQQTIECDGVAREWLLREKPTDVEYIKLNTVSKAFGEDPNDDESGNDFMYQKEEKYIREIGTATIGGDEIEVSYKYEVPILVPLASTSSIAAMKAIEGGDGIHSFTIVDTQIKSKVEARQRAFKELAEYADPLVNATFFTNTGLLNGSIFEPGQALTVNLPTWNINTDTDYLIQEVITNIINDGSNVYYEYEVRFGGRKLDVVAFLESLASKEDATNQSNEIDTVNLIAEQLQITETITRDQNAVSIVESVAISEIISKSNTTPPWEYGPSGVPQGKWGKAEWS